MRFQLRHTRMICLELVTGIEPASSDYKTEALPLSYTSTKRRD